MRISPEPEKAQVLDLRAKLQAARQAKKDCDDHQHHQSQAKTAEARITRALTRSLKIEEDEDSEDWEESRHCSVSKYFSDTHTLTVCIESNYGVVWERCPS